MNRIALEVTVKNALQAPDETRVPALRKSNPEWLFKSIASILALFSGNINTQYKLTPQQIEIITTDLITDCPDWSIYDFVLFFRAAAKGEYGELKYGVDQARIYEMKAQYEGRRAEAREQELHNQKHEHMDNLTNAGRSILGRMAKDPEFREQLSKKKESTPGSGFGSRLREEFERFAPKPNNEQ